jgi:hypothetical protein
LTSRFITLYQIDRTGSRSPKSPARLGIPQRRKKSVNTAQRTGVMRRYGFDNLAREDKIRRSLVCQDAVI